MNKTIKLKKLSDVDVSKVFPVLNEEFYKLIEGKELTLNTTQLKQLASGYFNLGNFSISKDLIHTEEANSTDAIIMAVKAHIASTTLFMEDMAEAIVHGITLGENVMLYGRGGHNKSEGTIQILNFLKDKGIISSEPFIKSLGDGTTVEDLFGGVKMKLAMEEGIIEYNVENSFMNHEIVVFEEGFDAPSQVLTSLKDIITSKQFRNGNQIFDVKTKCIIIATNKSKKEIAVDDSVEALAQRFPITCLVEWGEKNYTRENFMKLFSFTIDKETYAKKKEKLVKLAKLCADTCSKNQDKFISPRSAVKAAKLYCNGGSLRFISDFDPKVIEILEKEGGDQDEIITQQTEFYRELLQYVDNHSVLTVGNPAAAKLLAGFGKTNPASNKDKHERINMLMGVLSSVSWHSSLSSDINTFKTKLMQVANS